MEKKGKSWKGNKVGEAIRAPVLRENEYHQEYQDNPQRFRQWKIR